MFVRCAPGQTNPLYPNDPVACAPTIDGFRYETVQIDAAQLDRHGPSGIWVVTGWQMLPPFEQRTPPSDAEVTALLNGFLEARVAGEGAERYLTTPRKPSRCSTRRPAGLPTREQSSSSCMAPSGHTGSWSRTSGYVTANEGFTLDGPVAYDGIPATTENGQTVPDRYSIVDGEVTFAAADPPWRVADWAGSSRTMSTVLHGGIYGGIKILADPVPVERRCEADTRPTPRPWPRASSRIPTSTQAHPFPSASRV